MKYQIEAKPYGEYDVVVCGGGTAGCFAAIAAAREGAKTLLIERSFVVGGMLTVGEAGITKFTEHCKDIERYKKEVLDRLATDPKGVQVVGGIPHEYVKRLIDSGKALGTHGEAGSYVFTDKAASQYLLIEMLEEAGVEVLYDTRVCLVEKDGDAVKAVVVCNKEGFGRIEAKCFVDATGDGDVAALAGVPVYEGASENEVAEGYARRVGEMCNFGTMYRVGNVDYDRLFDFLEKNSYRFVVQRFGVMSFENARESYYKGEMSVFMVKLSEPEELRGVVQVYTLPERGGAILLGPGCVVRPPDNNGLDARSMSRGQHALQMGARRLTEGLRATPGFENATVTYIPDLGVRETRRIVGEYELSVVDILSGRDFEDSIACGGHPIDIGAIPEEVENTDYNHWRFHIPYRIMLPKNVESLLITGRCVSASRGAWGAIRPTAQCMAMGEAAGLAAAMAAKEGISPKAVNVPTLRQKLLNNGAII